MYQHSNPDVSLETLLEQNQALMEENERLTERVKELDSFAQIAAHDLRNPIAAIRLRAGILSRYRDKHDPEDIIRAADFFISESERLEEILDAILLFSRADDDTPLDLAPVHMHEIIENTNQRLHKLIMRDNVHVQIVGDDWPLVMGYAPWIEQIWMNYITNAIKYGGEPPLIELGAKRCPNGMGIFWVRDNGEGLTKAQQARIFQPYIRLHQKKADGHGLGLAIVERIVKRLGGDIGVESVPGAGSKFKFMLPIV